MSPRAGGEADKFGSRYEGRWTVLRVLYILDGAGDSLTVEPFGDLSRGAEFVYQPRYGRTEIHQVKRQAGASNTWDVKSLQSAGVWGNARLHVESGRDFHFVSTLPAALAAELADRARRSDTLEIFVNEGLTSKELRETFTELSSPAVLMDAETAWNVLRGFYIRWPDETELVNSNAVLAEQLLEGASGRAAATAIGDMIADNLGLTLTADRIEQLLAKYSLRRATAARGATLRESIRRLSESWMESVSRQLLNTPIEREEARAILELRSEDEAVTFVVGVAGGGKSATLQQAVARLEADGHHVLAFRLDRLAGFTTTAQLGELLDLPISPVAALATIAEYRPCTLVVDQLDAVSLASGRLANNFDAVADLIREASSLPRMRIIMACRKFDVDNDHRIRELVSRPSSRSVAVGPLTDDQVNAAVSDMGLEPERLTPQQRDLLKVPLHLVLLETLAPEPSALDFETTLNLFDAFWDRKRRAIQGRREGTRFEAVIFTLAVEISGRQRLSVPAAVLDREGLGHDADILISEHVLARDGQQIAFFHEAFFDYAFARQWVTGDQSLVDFLTQGEQELFRRGQVRQIAQYLREVDPQRFVREIMDLLTSDRVRYHIKEVVLAVLGALADPNSAEAEMVVGIADGGPAYAGRLWQMLRTAAWFNRLRDDGNLDAWLQGTDEDRRARALELIGSAAREEPDSVAGLLSTLESRSDFDEWVRWTTRFAKLEGSRALFDLLLTAVRRGAYDDSEYELWISVHGLGNRQPFWAIELLDAWFAKRPNPVALDAGGRVANLTGGEYRASELITAASKAEPQTFIDRLLPFMRRVVEATARPAHQGVGLAKDRHFSHRFSDLQSGRDLDDAFLRATVSAIKARCSQAPAAMRPVLETLAADPYYTAQYLLYRGLIAGASTYADWAASLLLEGLHRLVCGYSSNSVWVTRLLLLAIRDHLPHALHRQLEDAVRDVRFPWESRRAGLYAFTLLSALDESRLSETGRRRLGEYRRLFETDQPAEPVGVTVGLIGSPIPTSALPRMTDAQWLGAIRKYADDRTNWNTFTGGASEISGDLRDEAKKDPQRFARLALELTSEANPAYGNAILMGLGDAPAQEPPGAVFDAIRHIASFAYSENDRWLGWSLRPYLKTAPLDLVELVRDRALTSDDPENDRPVIVTDSSTRRAAKDLHINGINTARGSLAETLGNLLVFDADGARTAAVAPALGRLASDPVLAVRGCVAQVIAAAMRHARPQAIAAFETLIATDDRLLVVDAVHRVLIYIGNEDSAAVTPTIKRMLASPDDEVRVAGGQLAAFAALEWDGSDPFARVFESSDPLVRKGVAHVCARRLPHSANAERAGAWLEVLVDDEDADVRAAAAEVAPVLRDRALRPFARTLNRVIASRTFSQAVPQLLITLQLASDNVHDLALAATKRFITEYRDEIGDIQTGGGAGDASYISELVVRGLAQSSDVVERKELLDALDELLRLGAYGIDDAIRQAER